MVMHLMSLKPACQRDNIILQVNSRMLEQPIEGSYI